MRKEKTNNKDLKKPKKTRQGASKNTKYSATGKNNAKKAPRGQGK
jgi:hypothetical protein